MCFESKTWLVVEWIVLEVVKQVCYYWGGQVIITYYLKLKSTKQLLSYTTFSDLILQKRTLTSRIIGYLGYSPYLSFFEG